MKYLLHQVQVFVNEIDVFELVVALLASQSLLLLCVPGRPLVPVAVHRELLPVADTLLSYFWL